MHVAFVGTYKAQKSIRDQMILSIGLYRPKRRTGPSTVHPHARSLARGRNWAVLSPFPWYASAPLVPSLCSIWYELLTTHTWWGQRVPDITHSEHARRPRHPSRRYCYPRRRTRPRALGIFALDELSVVSLPRSVHIYTPQFLC